MILVLNFLLTNNLKFNITCWLNIKESVEYYVFVQLKNSDHKVFASNENT